QDLKSPEFFFVEKRSKSWYKDVISKLNEIVVLEEITDLNFDVSRVFSFQLPTQIEKTDYLLYLSLVGNYCAICKALNVEGSMAMKEFLDEDELEENKRILDTLLAADLVLLDHKILKKEIDTNLAPIGYEPDDLTFGTTLFSLNHQ
ncbi:MAG: hypothetical protein AB8F95_20535, partial [Bacteroidia bacterium]